jgi:exodeoxyribonuclease V alpha subunit
VVGVMPELIEGEYVEFEGEWVENPQYGKQFKPHSVIPVSPNTEKGIVRYLSEVVEGIGESTAKRIYNKFGDQTIHILETDPERAISEVGLKSKLVENIIKAFSESRVERQTMIMLQNYGITPSLAKKIFDEYGSDSATIVKEDPYKLADEIDGVGFKKADQIARNIGIPENSNLRLRAGLSYALSQLSNEGHTFAPRDVLIQKAIDLLEINDSIMFNQILSMQILNGSLFSENLRITPEKPIEAIYLPMFYRSEVSVSRRLRVMHSTPSKITIQAKKIKWDKFIEEISELNSVKLTEQQKSAVKAAFESKVSVLTGGPGTGKTTTLKMVINALENQEFKVALASPTGRAAKRLFEATDRSASTIHRLLEFSAQEGGFTFDENNPLKVDMLVIDESSMLDLMLFHHVMKALPPTAHLLLVGDVDQLPSVGAGNVLRDVIDSGVAYVTRLDTIFRQDSKSYIVRNAHMINHGEMPMMDNQSEDFFYFKSEEVQDTSSLLVDVVINRLPNKFGYSPMDDIQVLSPMYRGLAGVDALNNALQQKLNGDFGLAQWKLGERVFRKNDKVMQTKNNYEKEVFNGDSGRVYSVDLENKILTVLIDGREIEYDQKEIEEQLIHAYCISTHRSQGSEYPVVVMPMTGQHYMMLQRNLLYTAITRAKKVVVLVGEKKAVWMAVNNNKVAERYSGLLTRLKV